MILVGIDDTDILGSRGTNHLARDLVRRLAGSFHCHRILRHQLLFDPRIPYTSHNGSASLAFQPLGRAGPAELMDAMRAGMLADFIEGSDPGLCVAVDVPPAVVAFAERCRREIVTKEEARAVAAKAGIPLEGLGGTEGGVIGALAAIGLARTGNHGRIVHDVHDCGSGFDGDLPIGFLRARGVDAVVEEVSGREIDHGVIEVRKKLRPNRRGGRTVLLVEAAGPDRWTALRRD